MDRDCIVSFLLKNDFLIYLWRLFHLGNWYDVIGKNYLWLSIFPVCRIWAHWRAQWKDQGRRGHHGEVQTDLPAPLTAGHIQKRDHTSLLWGDPDWRKVCGFSQNIGKMNIQTFCQLWLTWQNIDRSWLHVALEHIWCLKKQGCSDFRTLPAQQHHWKCIKYRQAWHLQDIQWDVPEEDT